MYVFLAGYISSNIPYVTPQTKCGIFFFFYVLSYVEEILVSEIFGVASSDQGGFRINEVRTKHQLFKPCTLPNTYDSHACTFFCYERTLKSLNTGKISLLQYRISN